MAPASNAAVIVIFHREKSGKSDRIFPYEEEEATCILVALNICRELLNHEKGQQALMKMTELFTRRHPKGWYAKWKPDEVVKKFVDLILDTFPLVFSDDGFPNPNVSGCHHRRIWDRFFSRHQGICLNGSRVRDMCAAAKKAKESNDPKSKEHEQYRTFIFFFAVTLFHELGHVFITFLSLGERDSPEEMVPKLIDPYQRDQAEAGITLEGLVFGGYVIHARDDNYDESQPGAPYLVTNDRVGRISQQIVDDFVKCNFDLPFVTSGPAPEEPLMLFGEGYDDTLPSDPLDPVKWPKTRELVENHSSSPFDFEGLEKLEPSLKTCKKVQLGPHSALARVAFQPTLRIEVVE